MIFQTRLSYFLYFDILLLIFFKSPITSCSKCDVICHSEENVITSPLFTSFRRESLAYSQERLILFNRIALLGSFPRDSHALDNQ